jgi:hypothetical protein
MKLSSIKTNQMNYQFTVFLVMLGMMLRLELSRLGTLLGLMLGMVKTEPCTQMLMGKREAGEG